MRFSTLIVIMLLWSLSFGAQTGGQQAPPVVSPVPVNCGKYYLRKWSGTTNYFCEKVGHFPWYAAGNDVNGRWQTEITGHTSSNTRDVQLQFVVSYQDMNGKMGGVWSGDELFQTATSGVTMPLLDGHRGTEIIFGNVDGEVTSRRLGSGLVTGSVRITVRGISEKALDEFTTQLTFIYTRNDGAVTWQVAVPIVWREDESNSWTAPIVETPLEVKGRTLPANNTSFAVVNLCDKPQRVEVSLHAWTGEKLAHFNTPELVAGVVMWQEPNMKLSGGVYANVISNVFGDVIRVGLLAPFVRVEEHRPLRGTLRFKGSVEGCTIAPLVLRALGDSITSLIAHPER